ncbi:MAG: hypothetical protein EOO05_05775 [Chitinophagaceae bacterium]|nr:MAG: hypothetical protein EOO05_05775 [Chitinophagaceae bacterium]
MNSNRRVLHLILYSTGLFLILSIAAIFSGFDWLPFQRVNLVSDVLVNPDDSLGTSITKGGGKDSLDIPVVIESKPALDFNLYHQPASIGSFYTDSTRPSIERFIARLAALHEGKPVKIRIAYFGDSMIEGDLLTQTLRELLQKRFGGNGVGFVPVTSAVSKFRQTVTASYSNTWTDDNFKETKTNKLYLSGHSFHSDNAWVQMTDQTGYDSAAIVEKSLIYGPSHSSVIVNGGSQTLPGTKPVNRTPIASNSSRTVKVEVADNNLPVYGISFESASGVFVDNFSFRGITGVEFARIDSAFLHAIALENPYDLIVFQYGVNLLFRPNDKNFSWYARTMLPILKKIKGSFPETDFVLVSTADRAFRYGGEYKSAVGIDSLVKVQAVLAYETGSAFYNQFETMGGTNSIVDWAKQKPALANQDYVHPNHRGAAILGTRFYEAIMKEYNKYISRTAK